MSAGSSTIVPRATFTNTAPGFIAASSASPIMFSVSGVPAAASTTVSLRASRSCRPSGPNNSSTFGAVMPGS